LSIKAEDVKRLRDSTGAGMMDCKQALTDAEGDFEKAKDLLRERGIAKAGKLSERAADEGAVIAYLHQPSLDLPPKVGTLVELNCATDFVAKTERFLALGREIAMHITAKRPLVVSREDLPDDVVDRERKLFRAEAAASGKPDNVLDKIVEGKMKQWYADNVLLDQTWTRDETKTIADLLAEATAELKEPVKVRRFARFRVGGE
jgi:elongation factor Ts